LPHLLCVGGIISLPWFSKGTENDLSKNNYLRGVILILLVRESIKALMVIGDHLSMIEEKHTFRLDPSFSQSWLWVVWPRNHKIHINKLKCYGVIQTIRCHLCRGDTEDVNHLFFDWPFSHCIWFDLCSRCFIPFHHYFWVNTISWLSNLSGDRSLNYMLTRLILVSVIYYLKGEECTY
jgi:hypothetical protein